MANAVTVRYMPRQHGNCWVCRDSLSDRHHRVVAHVDPSNRGRLIHPVHKQCLLDAYRSNIQKCWCNAQLDLQRLLRRRNPEPLQRHSLINLERLQVGGVDQHALENDPSTIRQMLTLLLPTIPCLIKYWQISNEVHQNLTHAQDLSDEFLDPTECLKAGALIAAAALCIFGSHHERVILMKNALISTTASFTSTANMENLERTISKMLPFFLLWTAALLPSKRFRRKPCRFVCRAANCMFSNIKNELILGTAIGLSARVAAANENVPLQQFNASLLVGGAMIVCAIATGMWPIHRHPDRN
jgi:hypothetical protein